MSNPGILLTGADANLPYPGDDPGAVGQLVADLRTGRDRLRSLAAGIQDSLASMAQAWQGTDAEAARTEIAVLSTAAGRCGERVEAAAAAVERHQDDLIRIRRQIDGLRQSWTDQENANFWAGPGASFDPAVRAATAAVQQPLTQQWHALVADQDASAGACRAALDNAASGDWHYVAGAGAVRADLASAIGLSTLTFDDRARAADGELSRAQRDWTALTPDERAFYLGLGRSEYLSVAIADDPRSAAGLWADLDPMAQQALIHGEAAVIGRTDGLPVAIRDEANRAQLPALRAQVQAEYDHLWATTPAELAGPFDRNHLDPSDETQAWRGARDMVAGKLAAIDAVANGSLDGDGRPVYLIDIDPQDRGRIAVAYGNPDTAEGVVTMVPGTGAALGGVAGDFARTRTMVEAAEQAGGGNMAGVTWIDYIAPPDLSQARIDLYATAGAGHLTDFVDGLRASHDGDDGFRSTVIGHSYGTLVLGKAASGEHTLAADAIVFVASPGTGVDSVRELRLEGIPAQENGAHVFATVSDTDPIWLAPHATNYSGGGLDALMHEGTPTVDGDGIPTDRDYGATVFRSDANYSQGWIGSGDHSHYWNRGSSSLEAMANIVAGEPLDPPR